MSKPKGSLGLTEKQMEVFKSMLYSIGIKDYSLALSPAVEEGENFGGAIAKAVVKWSGKNGDSCSSHYILKCITSGSALENLIPLQDCFTREIYLYSKVFPQFTKMEAEHNARLKCYPDFYTSLETSEEKMLVLQDMKALGYRHHNRHQPLDYEHILLVVKSYARLHSLSYATRHQQSTLYEEFEKNTPDRFFDGFRYTGVRSVSEHRILNALKSLDPVVDGEIYHVFCDLNENLLSVLTNLINSKNQYQVISHIDCGLMNLLFKYDQTTNTPTDVCMIDWQHGRSESPAVDLITFIFSSSDSKTRERYHELIMEYHRCLCSSLEKLGCDGNKILPFSILENELKVYGIVGFCFAIFLIYVYSTVDQRLPDVLNDDSHAEGYSFVYDLQNKSVFDRRVKDAIIDFWRLGYNFK